MADSAAGTAASPVRRSSAKPAPSAMPTARPVAGTCTHRESANQPNDFAHRARARRVSRHRGARERREQRGRDVQAERPPMRRSPTGTSLATVPASPRSPAPHAPAATRNRERSHRWIAAAARPTTAAGTPHTRSPPQAGSAAPSRRLRHPAAGTTPADRCPRSARRSASSAAADTKPARAGAGCAAPAPSASSGLEVAASATAASSSAALRAVPGTGRRRPHHAPQGPSRYLRRSLRIAWICATAAASSACAFA